MTKTEELELPRAKDKNTNAVTGQYLNFSTSSILTNLGQTILPFLDIHKQKLSGFIYEKWRCRKFSIIAIFN